MFSNFGNQLELDVLGLLAERKRNEDLRLRKERGNWEERCIHYLDLLLLLQAIFKVGVGSKKTGSEDLCLCLLWFRVLQALNNGTNCFAIPAGEII